MKKLLLIALICGAAMIGNAQKAHVVQVSGVIVATDSLLPVPFATIYRSNDNRGTFADYNGYFTMPALVGDTIHFVSIGLKRSYFVVPVDTNQTHISIVQWMQLEEIMLPEVQVRRYPSPEKLRKELLALDLPGDNYYAFNRNAVSVTNYDGLADLSDQSTEMANEMLITRYSNGFKSGGNLLDPAAWGRFVRALKSGDRDK